LGLRF